MKSILLLTLTLTVTAFGSEQLSMFFKYDGGTRIDFSPASPKGKSSDDSFPDSAVMHVQIPQDSSDAQISITYGKGAEGREDQSYNGAVIHRTKDMISIVCKFGLMDKIENIVIYPTKASAFLIVHSAYLGIDLLKTMSSKDPDIPYGTASVFRLRQFKK
jgi:hypothetical protein